MQRRIRGEITVFFTLIFVVFLSFINSMLFLASIQTSKNKAKMSVNLAVNSVFAEYQRDLLNEYDIFALDGSYESGNYSVSNIINRLSYYGASGMEHEIKNIQYLTDNNGTGFYEQAVKSVLGKYGLHISTGDQMESWEKQDSYADDYARQENRAESQFQEILEDQELDLGDKSPFRFLKEWKSRGLLALVLPENEVLSNQNIQLQEQVSHRSLNQGTDRLHRKSYSGTKYKILFGKYVMDHFSCFTSEERNGVLQYEQEYLIGGHASDTENLEATANKILRIRLGANFLYLNTDEVKKSEARAIATVVATGAGFPALVEPILQGILAAWAYAESVSDVKTLLSGQKVSLMKTSSEWRMDLDSVWNMGSGSSTVPAVESSKGLSYQQYLEMILFLTTLKDEKMRAIDVIEQNLRNVKGKSFFYADYCINRIENHTIAYLERGITYEFDTEFGYE